MSRTRLVAVGTLVLLLAAAPFIPRGGGDQGSLRPASDQQYAARAVPSGPGAVSTSMRRTIDQALARDTAGRVPCAVFERQQYCVGVGWTDQDQSSLAESLTLGRRATTGAESTGDLAPSAITARRAALPDRQRLEDDRAELETAAASVAKVVLLRHEILGTPLPAGFLDRHPEARTAVSSRAMAASSSATATKSATSSPTSSPSSQTTTARTKRLGDYPKFRAILDPRHVSQQSRTYYCGPTSMQMITWGWSGTRRSQNHWASRLHTTTSGTGITDMVRVVNEDTGWDKDKYAGPYITLDIKDWTFKQWLLLNVRHVADYHAPLVLHPILLKKFYPYLDDDASGHFQVGRGYDRRGDNPPKIGYFEPWNQQRFDPSEPYIERVQWRQAYKSYRANEAHFQHNIGV